MFDCFITTFPFSTVALSAWCVSTCRRRETRHRLSSTNRGSCSCRHWDWERKQGGLYVGVKQVETFHFLQKYVLFKLCTELSEFIITHPSWVKDIVSVHFKDHIIYKHNWVTLCKYFIKTPPLAQDQAMTPDFTQSHHTNTVLTRNVEITMHYRSITIQSSNHNAL
jgi:hypothetical protein